MILPRARSQKIQCQQVQIRVTLAVFHLLKRMRSRSLEKVPLSQSSRQTPSQWYQNESQRNRFQVRLATLLSA